METAMFARFFRRTSSLLLVGQFLLWLSAWAGDKEEVVADLPKKRAPAIPRVGIRRHVFPSGCSGGRLAAAARGRVEVAAPESTPVFIEPSRKQL